MTNKVKTAAYFDSFRIEYIPEKVLSKIKDISTTRNIVRIQFDDSIICRFYSFITYAWRERFVR